MAISIALLAATSARAAEYHKIISGPCDGANCYAYSPPVPAGKILRMQRASCMIVLESPADQSTAFESFTLSVADSVGRNVNSEYLPWLFQGRRLTGQTALESYASGQSVRMFAKGRQHFAIKATFLSGTPTSMVCTLAGQLNG